MSFFKNMDEPGTNDISKHPGYASLPDDVRKEVNNRYESVYNNSVGRMGVRIAQGIAYETAKQMCEAFVAEKHMGFKAVQNSIEDKEGYSKERAGAIAASIGRKKYGAKAMKSAAKNHHPLGEGEAQEFQDANDAQVGMSEGDDYGVTQQAHVPQAHPQDLGGDADLISRVSAVMYNPANAFSNSQGDPEDKGPKSIQKMNHRSKGMNDTASQNEAEDEHDEHEFKTTPECGSDCYKNMQHSVMCPHSNYPDSHNDMAEQLDASIIAAAAGYIKHRAEVSGIMESVEDDSKKKELTEGKNHTFKDIERGDSVKYHTPQGQVGSGTAHHHGGTAGDHWVLSNSSKSGGSGQIVSAKNFHSLKKGKKAPMSGALSALVYGPGGKKS